jgi:hypothetical protein
LPATRGVLARYCVMIMIHSRSPCKAHVTGHLRAVTAGMFTGGRSADLVVATDATDAAPYSGALVQVKGTGEGIDPATARVMGLAVPRQGGDGFDEYFGGSRWFPGRMVSRGGR